MACATDVCRAMPPTVARTQSLLPPKRRSHWSANATPGSPGCRPTGCLSVPEPKRAVPQLPRQSLAAQSVPQICLAVQLAGTAGRDGEFARDANSELAPTHCHTCRLGLKILSRLGASRETWRSALRAAGRRPRELYHRGTLWRPEATVSRAPRQLHRVRDPALPRKPGAALSAPSPGKADSLDGSSTGGRHPSARGRCHSDEQCPQCEAATPLQTTRTVGPGATLTGAQTSGACG